MSKWLTMGTTPSAVRAEVAAAEEAAKAKYTRTWQEASATKRDHVAFCYWLNETFPDGFTYSDLVEVKGRKANYWGQYIFVLKNLSPGLIESLGSRLTGNLQGRCSVYRVDATRINELQKVLNARRVIHSKRSLIGS